MIHDNEEMVNEGFVIGELLGLWYIRRLSQPVMPGFRYIREDGQSTYVVWLTRDGYWESDASYPRELALLLIESDITISRHWDSCANRSAVHNWTMEGCE